MYEIEAKVWIKDQKKWQALLSQIAEDAIFKEELTKNDTYFSKQNNNKIIFRLRKTGTNKCCVTVKEKTITNGIEKSLEHCFEIDNEEAFLYFCKATGLKAVLQKTKHSKIYQQNSLNIELNTIKNLGNFLEIERICKSKTEIKQAEKTIKKQFAIYGYTEKDFEEIPYFKLIQKA